MSTTLSLFKPHGSFTNYQKCNLYHYKTEKQTYNRTNNETLQWPLEKQRVIFYWEEINEGSLMGKALK